MQKTGSLLHGKNNRKPGIPEHYYPRGFQCPQHPMGKRKDRQKWPHN